LGVKGCREILDLVNKSSYSHIACAVGTGTMFIGITNSSLPQQHIIGISVLKGMKNLPDQFNELAYLPEKIKYCKIFYDYHGGGYAQHTPELFSFMNDFYLQTGIPTDFVYTGKLVYGITELVKQRYFPQESSLIIIHSGGLQGNESLPKGTLIF
jgi:1-aminocyclopropane-1-carboxylate deaminase